jgi:hypothetical protein
LAAVGPDPVNVASEASYISWRWRQRSRAEREE